MEGEFSKEQAGGWGDLNGAAIDIIVEHLKLSERWSRDGRSLRSLNRHWRDIITLHVTHLHPLPDRVIEDEDLDSLEKFSGVISVDFTAFLCQDRETVEKHRWHKTKPNTARLLKLLKNLQRLPRLEELKTDLEKYPLDCLKVNELEEDVRSAMAKLTGVSILSFESHPDRRPTAKDLSIFSPLPVQEISGWVSATDSRCPVDVFPFLKKAWIVNGQAGLFPLPTNAQNISEGSSKRASLDFVSDLKSLRLETSDTMDFQYLPDKRVLECLRASFKVFEELESLKDLPHLKNLSLDCTNIDNKDLGLGPYPSEFLSEDHLAPFQKLTRLENLELILPATEFSFATWNRFFEGLSVLKSLSLTNANFEEDIILKHLQNLEVLKLIDCVIIDSEQFVGFDEEPGSLGWNTLQRIRELEIEDEDFSCSAFAVYPYFSGLSKMSRLQRFVYRSSTYIEIERLEALALCPSLRYLEIGYTGWNSDFGKNVILSLRHLDVLRMKFSPIQLLGIEEIERAVVELKAKSPWISLQITVIPFHIWCNTINELEESLKKARELIDKAEISPLKLTDASFMARICIKTREEVSALSKAVEKYSLLKNSPDWMSVRTNIKVRSDPFAEALKVEELEGVFNKIRNLCPQGDLCVNDRYNIARYSYNPHDPT